MSERTIQFRLGIGALLASAILFLYAIPTWVAAPSNVPNIVLSPVFWPNILAGLTALTGLGLVLLSSRASEEPQSSETHEQKAGWLRLGLIALVMLGVLYGLPRIGMVWTCMAGFAATAFIVRTRHPKAALITAVLVPLALYFFFAHVAGVAIPQGNFVRLP